MTEGQVAGLVRSLFLVLGGFAFKYGIDEATWAAITSGVVMIAAAAWSYYSNSTRRMAQLVARQPETVAIVVDSKKFADAVPSPKVVPYDPEADIGRS
jgi:hypothetical protein